MDILGIVAMLGMVSCIMFCAASFEPVHPSYTTRADERRVAIRVCLGLVGTILFGMVLLYSLITHN